MKIVVLICRVLLGLGFIVFGANILHPFMPAGEHPPVDSYAGHFMAAMMPSGYMKFVGVLQILGGLLVLIGSTAPLGLTILAPILVNILCFHTFLMGGHGVVAGLVFALFELVLIYAYRQYFAGLFSTKADPAV